MKKLKTKVSLVLGVAILATSISVTPAFACENELVKRQPGGYMRANKESSGLEHETWKDFVHAFPIRAAAEEFQKEANDELELETPVIEEPIIEEPVIETPVIEEPASEPDGKLDISPKKPDGEIEQEKGITKEPAQDIEKLEEKNSNKDNSPQIEESLDEYHQKENEEQIEPVDNEKKGRVIIATGGADIDTVKRHYAHVDCPGHADFLNEDNANKNDKVNMWKVQATHAAVKAHNDNTTKYQRILPLIALHGSAKFNTQTAFVDQHNLEHPSLTWTKVFAEVNDNKKINDEYGKLVPRQIQDIEPHRVDWVQTGPAQIFVRQTHTGFVTANNNASAIKHAAHTIFQEIEDRGGTTAFQTHALYPHMTVYDNMAFGLKLRKAPKDEIDKKVKEAAEILDKNELRQHPEMGYRSGINSMVAVGKQMFAKGFNIPENIPNYEFRFYKLKIGNAPSEPEDNVYSYRRLPAFTDTPRFIEKIPTVNETKIPYIPWYETLGRAIVRNPKIFLMDEPLPNLDTKLRVWMRLEIDTNKDIRKPLMANAGGLYTVISQLSLPANHAKVMPIPVIHAPIPLIYGLESLGSNKTDRTGLAIVTLSHPDIRDGSGNATGEIKPFSTTRGFGYIVFENNAANDKSDRTANITKFVRPMRTMLGANSFPREESLESALRRFKRSTARYGVVPDVRKREHYEKPSTKRKKKSEAARKRKY